MSKKDKQRVNNLADQSVYDEYKNNIPEEEIWIYQIDGLQEPHINKPFRNAGRKKVIVVAVLLVAIGLSIFFSANVIHSETFTYKETETGYELVKFSNPGELKSVTIDYVTDVKVETKDKLDENGEPVLDDNGKKVLVTEYAFTKDKTKPITSVHEYAFNCDEKVEEIVIGKDVQSIDGKSFYTCNRLRVIRVDEANEYYCDVDGVLFNKDMTELICYPIDHDKYLRHKFGYETGEDDDNQYWPTEDWKKKGLDKYNDKYTREYEDRINTYVVPATVKVIGELAFNYSELFRVYLPEGVERLETLAFFRNWHLELLDTYTGEVAEGALPTEDQLKPSLPDSLTFIGSDCFNSAEQMDYMFIPANVTEIGHHAFWGAASKDGDGNLFGILEIHVALDEETFKKNVTVGDQWTGEYTKGLFPTKVPVAYGAKRGE